jgi:hypothetical protein
VSSDERLRAFLADSLELWGVNARVEAGALPAVAQISAEGGTVVWIERIPEGTMPFRWMVRRTDAGVLREARPRPCGSLVGVLGALRAALGVDRGTPVHIAPPPVGE